jgi:hypothetical protein
MKRIVIASLGLALAAGLALPGSAQSLPGTVALSPEERAAVLDAAASRRPDESLPLNGDARQIHGEMGFEIGTRGTRTLFGSTVVPLGENGSAAFSFMTGQQGRWR